MIENFLSVIICTRNRADELKGNLPLLIEQAKEFDDVEVLVVDNGSTDNTKDVVENISKQFNFKIRYIFEPAVGSSQARNRGAAESHGKTVAYIDDDVKLKNHWVANVRQHFIEKRSDCLGGRVHIQLGGETPFNLDQEMLWFFMEVDLGDQAREFLPTDRVNYPIGCNMAFTSEVFNKIGGFNTKLTLYGDETEFFQRSRQCGFKSVYDPNVSVVQYIPAERLTKQALQRKACKLGKGNAALWLLSSPRFEQKVYVIAKNCLRALYFALISLTQSSFGKFLKKWFYFAFVVQLLKAKK